MEPQYGENISKLIGLTEIYVRAELFHTTFEVLITVLQ